MRKLAFCICKNKDTAQISSFVFASSIVLVQFLFLLNSKFQASSHLLWLNSLACVDVDGNHKDRFSRYGAHMILPLDKFLSIHKHLATLNKHLQMLVNCCVAVPSCGRLPSANHYHSHPTNHSRISAKIRNHLRPRI